MMPAAVPLTHRAWEPILAVGRNCWAIAEAQSAGLLIDGDNFYRGFYEAARQAQHSILLAGWKFNSDVRLLRGRRAESVGNDVRLVPFLAGLCAENPRLQVHVLAWDFSVNYALEWERHQQRPFEEAAPGQVHFQFDAHHATGGSHHQKLAVVDSNVAFVGGLDLNADGWDERAHRAHDPDRRDSGQEPHDPYHDLQAYLVGPVAAELAKYFAHRWHEATGEELLLPPPATTFPRIARGVRLNPAPVALSRNESKTLQDGDSEHEILHLFCDAITKAERLIYLENQYFSSREVFQALVGRMRDAGRPRLAIVLVLPKQLFSWVETAAMDPPRLTMLDRLREVADETGHRLGVYYPVACGGQAEVAVKIHSKLLLVDDRFLTVGSCNVSNRSMGLDSELNVSWEATSPDDHEMVRSIRRVRVSLLGEHAGLSAKAEARRRLRRTDDLVAYLDDVASSGAHGLRHLTREAIVGDRAWLENLERWGLSFDPRTPVLEESVHEALAPASRSLLMRGFRWLLGS
jgi:phospholipase D1/2